MKSFYIRYQSPHRDRPSITAQPAYDAQAARECFASDNPTCEVLAVWPQNDDPPLQWIVSDNGGNDDLVMPKL